MPTYFGGVHSVEFVPSDIGYGSATESDITLLSKHTLITEGQQLPVPETLEAELASGQGAPTGEDVPFEVRAKNMDATAADDLRNDGYDTVPYDVRYTSLDQTIEMVLLEVILRVATSPIAERGSYGFVRIGGEATSSGKDKPYEVNDIS